jgi:GH43 family beta-xylosidase
MPSIAIVHRCQWFRRVAIGNMLVVGLLFLALPALVARAEQPPFTLNRDAIRIRDPFIFVNPPKHMYLMYASADSAPQQSHGVQVYASKDLFRWTKPRQVLSLDNIAKVAEVWAPEMHEYKGKYYIFVTLGLNQPIPTEAGKPAKPLTMRGVYVFVADSPYGPFQSFKTTSHTPENWSALDGTLYVEEGKPYMVFCHEWTQIVDGTIEYMPLKDDLSGAAGKPETLFRGSDAPEADKNPNTMKVTDGCFLYRSPKSKKLYMTWSTLIPGKNYCVVLAESESGKLAGPWKQQRLLYTQDGGHSMFFRSFDGSLRMALHQPNNSPNERLRLFKIVESNGTLKIGL